MIENGLRQDTNSARYRIMVCNHHTNSGNLPVVVTEPAMRNCNTIRNAILAFLALARSYKETSFTSTIKTGEIQRQTKHKDRRRLTEHNTYSKRNYTTIRQRRGSGSLTTQAYRVPQCWAAISKGRISPTSIKSMPFLLPNDSNKT